MKTNGLNPTNNPAKVTPVAAGATKIPSQTIPKTDLQPDSLPLTEKPKVAPAKPADSPIHAADTKLSAAPSHGKGRDADLSPDPRANKDGSINRSQPG